MTDCTVSFHLEALNAAHREHGWAIDGFTEALDRISNDIKKLEDYLDGSGVRVRLDVVINEREFLSWAEVDDAQRWRIVYEQLAMHPIEGFEGFVRSGPLIEMPVDVRLRAYQYLPGLLEAAAQKIPAESLIPF
jgi:hypothetical protein